MQTAKKGKGTVLIIDDDRMIVDLVKMAFAGDGYQVMSAQSGTELNELLASVDLTAKNAFDLILLDLLLPDTSGEELYNLLRANDNLARIPIIILSAAAAVQKRIQLLKMGADDYIIKPFNVDDLLMRATVHIRLGKMRQAKDEIHNRLSLLGEIAGTLRSPDGLDHSLVQTINNILTVIQAGHGDIFLPEQLNQAASTTTIRTLKDVYLFQGQLDSSITATSLETNSPCLVNNVQEEGHFSPQIDQVSGQTTDSIICVPMKVGQDTTCVLRIFNKRHGDFTEDDLEVVASAANIISVAIENDYLNQLLKSTTQSPVKT